MTGFIPEITTTVSATLNIEGLDECIDILNSDEVMQTCFNDLIPLFEETKNELENLADPVAEWYSNRLSSTQEEIIQMKHFVTGMMGNSVDVMHDGDGVYLVGNTATSVDGFPYPLAIETGRREVYPVEKKWLRWFDGGDYGKPIFAKKSGSVKADPFVQPSIDLTERMVEDALDEVQQLKSIVNRFQ